ncbi:hydrolase, TatD family protein, partial [Vibrio cholerae HC-41B1]
MEIIFR